MEDEVILHRKEYIAMLKQLQKRMRVWVILSEEEEEAYLEVQRKSPIPTAMPVGEEVKIDGTSTFVHHMDDQGGWEDNPILHPLFKPGSKPLEEEWECIFGNLYDTCLCHLELRE